MKKVKTIYPDKPAKDFNEWVNHIHSYFRTSAMSEEMEAAKQRVTTKFLTNKN